MSARFISGHYKDVNKDNEIYTKTKQRVEHVIKTEM